MFVMRVGELPTVRLGISRLQFSHETPGGNAELVKKDAKTWSLPRTVPLGSGIRIGAS